MGASAKPLALGDLLVSGWDDLFAAAHLRCLGCVGRYRRDSEQREYVFGLPGRLDGDAAALGFPKHRLSCQHFWHLHVGNAPEQHPKRQLQLSIGHDGAPCADVWRLVCLV